MDFQYRILGHVISVGKKSCIPLYNNISTCMFILLNIRCMFLAAAFSSVDRSFVVPHQRRGKPPTAIVKWCVFHGWIGKDIQNLFIQIVRNLCVYLLVCKEKHSNKKNYEWMNGEREREGSTKNQHRHTHTHTHQNNNNASNWSWRWNNIVACIIWRHLHFVAATAQHNTIL